ncbi:MAG: tyrosine-type recombinase/integrase [Rhodospirillaceae bacterium]|jgi:site-specific recombinase XerD
MYADKSSGLERISIHGLRHTFAIRLIAKDVDIAKVAALLGHKSLQSAMLYNQIAPKHLDSAIALLDQDYGRNPLLGQAQSRHEGML